MLLGRDDFPLTLSVMVILSLFLMKKGRSDTLNWKQTFLRGVLIDVYYSSECLLALSFYMRFKSFFC